MENRLAAGESPRPPIRSAKTNPTEVYGELESHELQQLSFRRAGFVLWMSTFVAFFAFLLWAFLPESVLQSVGVTYYPSKYVVASLPSKRAGNELISCCSGQMVGDCDSGVFLRAAAVRGGRLRCVQSLQHKSARLVLHHHRLAILVCCSSISAALASIQILIRDQWIRRSCKRTCSSLTD